MAATSFQNPWLRRAFTFVKMGVVLTVVAIGGLLLLFDVGEALLHWKSSSLRDRRDFGEEQNLENRINRVIQDETLRIGQSIILSDIIAQQMRQACIQGRRVPNHVWLYGPTIKLMRKSYRPYRNSLIGDHYGEMLAVEFPDGRALGFYVSFSGFAASFLTLDQYACAAGGRLVFTRLNGSTIGIRGTEARCEGSSSSCNGCSRSSP